MIKSIKSRGLCFILCGALLVGTTTACKSQFPSNLSEPSASLSQSDVQTPETQSEAAELFNEFDNGITRTEYSKQADELKQSYQQNPDDQALGLGYAQALFALGEFALSQEVLMPLLSNEMPLPDVIFLSAQIEYLNGNYTQAEKLYKTLIEQNPDEFKASAEAGLMMIYYQTNQYQKSGQLFIGQEEAMNPLLDMMKAFGDDQPYQISWNGREESVIPFVVTDPLPVVPVEINGHRINAIIDTGGPMFVVNEAFATILGIKPASNMEGEFAGGNTAEIGFGRADSIRIGDVNIQNIPVMLGPFDGFANTFSGYASDVHGVIGTNVLQQFVATLDYPNGQLVLRPRNEAGRDNLNRMLANDKLLEEIPFTLALTHYIFAKGSINQNSGLNLFVDSGFNDQKGAGIILPEETMDSLGIPMPELKAAVEGEGGMGGSDYKEGYFGLSAYGLGNLQMQNGIGYFATGDAMYYDEELGFFQDGLISHNYLKAYKWTLNFDTMKMIFCE